MLSGCVSKPVVNNNEEIIDQEEHSVENVTMNYTITINNEVFELILDDNTTVDAFKQLLPLTITLQDLYGNEKYASLSSNLVMNNQRVNNIEVGDVMLYGSDGLVIFYDNFETIYSYSRIGKIKDTNRLLDVIGAGSITVTIQ